MFFRLLDTTVHFSYLNKLSYWQTHSLFPDIKISQHNDHLKKSELFQTTPALRDTNRNHVKLLYFMPFNPVRFSQQVQITQRKYAFFPKYDLFHLMALRSFWKRPPLHLDLFWKCFSVFSGRVSTVLRENLVIWVGCFPLAEFVEHWHLTRAFSVSVFEVRQKMMNYLWLLPELNDKAPEWQHPHRPPSIKEGFIY